MPNSVPEIWWILGIGTTVFVALVIGLIITVAMNQKRYMAAQKQKFLELQESEKRFKRLVEHSPVPTIVLINEAIDYANTAFLALIKASGFDQINKKSIFEILHPSIRDMEFERLHHVVIERENASAEESLLVALDNSVIDVEIAATPIVLAGNEGAQVIFYDITQRKAAERALQELPKHIIETQEAERRRVSRELHDGVNQILFNAQFTLQSLEVKYSATSNGNGFSEVRKPIELAMKEIQRISRNLRPSALDELGLLSAINGFCNDFNKRTHITTIVKEGALSIEDRFAPEIELCLFRVIQEALNNIEKHSMATRVTIEFSTVGNFMTVTITDDGKGFDTRQKFGPSDRGTGMGLTTMKERAELVGGTFSINSEINRKTVITITVPLIKIDSFIHD